MEPPNSTFILKDPGVHHPYVDKQYAFAVVLVIIGLGLAMMEGNEFYTGLGIGTLFIALAWIVFIIIKEYKRR